MTEEEQLQKILAVAKMHETDSRIINSVDDLAVDKINTHIKKAEIESSTHDDFNIRVRRIVNVEELENVLAGYNLKFKDMKFASPKKPLPQIIANTVDKNTLQPLVVINIGEHFYSVPVALQKKYKQKNKGFWGRLFSVFSGTKQEQVPTKTIWDR